MNVRRPSCAVVSVILIAAGFLLSPPTTAYAATCSGATYQDFDDDGHADIVVARTLPATQVGVVDIVMSGGTTQTISATSIGYASSVNDQFGADITVSNMDGLDECPDLAIGAPGTPGGGAIYLVRGNAHGVGGTPARILSPSAGERFGTTVGALDLSWTGMKLLVGAPGLSVGGVAEAGGVWVWQLTNGAPTGIPALYTYKTFGAVPAASDHLGAVMDVSDYQVELGVPNRDIGAAKDAGEVITFEFTDETGPITLRDWTRANQNSPKAPDKAETGDHFGASVDADGAYVLVGVPGEDVGARKDTGMVMRYAPLTNHKTSSWKSWTQNSSGVPGTNEKGDQWGAAVHLGWVEVEIDDDPYPMPVYVVGAPGEDVGKVKDAGAITIMAPGVKPAFALNQGAGLPGKAEKGDRVGAAFGDFQGEYHGPYHGGDGLLVGAPGEDVGSVVDAGVVISARGLLPKGKYAWTSTSNVGAPVAGTRYGWTRPRK
jgi:hypothetical protein